MSDRKYAQLVERLIRAEHARNIAERKVRALEDPLGSDHGLTALAVRVEELEAIVAKQNTTIISLQRRTG